MQHRIEKIEQNSGTGYIIVNLNRDKL